MEDGCKGKTPLERFLAGEVVVEARGADFDELAAMMDGLGVPWVSGLKWGEMAPENRAVGCFYTFGGSGVAEFGRTSRPRIPFAALRQKGQNTTVEGGRIMERFLKGECYVVVKSEDWDAFARECDDAGLLWHGGQKVSEFESPELGMARRIGEAIRALVLGGRLCWANVDEPKSFELPVVGFRNLKPLPVEPADREIITSDGATITARLLNMKRTTTTATATCSPKDTFRFGPGALLAMYRALDNDGDRMLAMDLIWKEALKQLEAEFPGIGDLVFGEAPSAEARMLGEFIADGLSMALGEPFSVIAGEPRRGASWIAHAIEAALGKGLQAGL